MARNFDSVRSKPDLDVLLACQSSLEVLRLYRRTRAIGLSWRTVKESRWPPELEDSFELGQKSRSNESQYLASNMLARRKYYDEDSMALSEPLMEDRSSPRYGPGEDRLSRLPPELIMMIFDYLDTVTLLAASLVCRTWQRHALHPYVWRRIHMTRCTSNMLARMRLVRQQMPFVRSLCLDIMDCHCPARRILLAGAPWPNLEELILKVWIFCGEKFVMLLTHLRASKLKRIHVVCHAHLIDEDGIRMHATDIKASYPEFEAFTLKKIPPTESLVVSGLRYPQRQSITIRL